MPIIAHVGRKHWRVRLLHWGIIAILAILGMTMVYPFLFTLTSASSNALDYYRYAPVPRALWSREERFMKGLVPYFPEGMRGGMEQFALAFPAAPPAWTNWKAVGDDPAAADAFARGYLRQAADPAHLAQIQLAAADYDAFARRHPIGDSICAINEQHFAPYLRDHYRQLARGEGKPSDAEALRLMGVAWDVPVTSFYVVRPEPENQTPWDQPGYCPPNDGRSRDFAGMREAYRDRAFAPAGIQRKWWALLASPAARQVIGLTGTGPLSVNELNAAAGTHYRSMQDVPYPVPADAPAAVQNLWGHFSGTIIPACETRPFPMKSVWLRYLRSGAARAAMGLTGDAEITVEEYNRVAGTHYADLRQVPFPVPANAPAPLRAAWEDFVQHRYPARLLSVAVTPELETRYRTFVRDRFKGDLPRANSILGTQFPAWDALHLSASMPREDEALASLWVEFIGGLPAAAKTPHSAEAAYQQYLLATYGSVAEMNHRYGWALTCIEEAEMPFDLAYLVTFITNERELSLASAWGNYSFVLDYLLFRGRAVWNTVVLVVLTLLAALTVNPLAAYALSRFQMRQTPAIILFLLATTAFPAAVSMIPGYLLMRDLHLLNTYAALILPGIASGMSIFLLKGFFDSLPPELYEAAALDGAKEWQVFLRITLPLSKPILAVIALNSFLASYNSWEWALISCQKEDMWTISVWLYQFSNTWANQPWAVVAGFVIASIPVFAVFLLAQNVILRGIVLPQMK